MVSVLAVDVGGSGLRAVLVDSDGDRGQVMTGPGAAIGPTGVDLAPLLDLVVARSDPSPPDVAVWSLRGLIGLGDPEVVLAELHSALRPGRTILVSDAVASLVGAIGHPAPGAVLAAGSGVVALATDFRQVWHRVDGWGHLLGDRGSGAWVGMEGLRAALRERDGLADGSTPLLEAGTRLWGDPATWPRRSLTGDHVHTLLAEFAPAVAGLADTDPVSAQICRAAGEHLAASLSAASGVLPGAPTAITGNLLRLEPIRRAFEHSARRRGLRLSPAAGSALDGAVVLGQHVAAGHHLGEHAPYVLSTGVSPLSES